MNEEKPYQLNPSDFKTGNMILDSFIKNAIKDVNKADFNHNGVPDISEYHPLFIKLMPLLVALNHAVDLEKLIRDYVGRHPEIVKDAVVLDHVILELQGLAAKVETLLPH